MPVIPEFASNRQELIILLIFLIFLLRKIRLSKMTKPYQSFIIGKDFEKGVAAPLPSFIIILEFINF